MSIQRSIDTMQFLTVEPQPDFPATDLTKLNSEIVPELFAKEPGILAHADRLQEHQHSLHHMAHRAIVSFVGKPLRYSKAEYTAFTEGFSDFEAISLVLHEPQEYNTSLALGRVGMHLIQPGHFADYEFSKRYQTWPEERPYTYDAIMAMGHIRGDSNPLHMHMRHAGAQLAFELQRPPLDVAR